MLRPDPLNLLIDSAEATAATYTYDAFGNLMVKTGSLDQSFQFSTKRYDTQTGLVYYGYRFYSPVQGRWVTRDPLGEAGGINLYSFVGNNSVNFVDPFGLWTFGIDLSVSWGLGGGGTGGITIVIDDNGNIGILGHAGGGGGSPSLGIMGGLQLTNADTICDLQGPSITAGASGGAGGIVGGADYVQGKGYQGVNVGGGLDLAGALSVPFETHGYLEYGKLFGTGKLW